MTNAAIQNQAPAIDCDIVVFKTPPSECSVFIANLPTSVTEEQLLEVFEQCGLVNSVRKFNPENLKRKSEQQVPTGCASVTYYTQQEAKRAIRELHRYQFDGVPITVKPSRALRETTHSHPLSFPKSVDICNHFLGFNRWSTRIIAIQKLVSEEVGNGEDVIQRGVADGEVKNEPASSDGVKLEPKADIFGEHPMEKEFAKFPKVRCEFECHIELTLDGQKATGRGTGKHTGRYLPKVYEVARKLSITDARKKAFAKVALMVLTSGKVKVHVDDEEERERQRILQEEEGEISGEDILAMMRIPTMI